MAEWSKALRSGRSPLLWAWVRIPLLTNSFVPHKKVIVIARHSFYYNQLINSRVAQWKRAGPITQRSVDRNYALLISFVLSPFSAAVLQLSGWPSGLRRQTQGKALLPR